jgi:hypothetical protein
MTLMTERKLPYWFSPTELKDLSQVLSMDDNISYNELVEGIRDEVGVARARAENSLISTSALAMVLGMMKDSVPLHLSDNEVAFLVTLPEIPFHIKNRLL